jgi:hypothetical protein
MIAAFTANSRAADASNAPPTTAPDWVDAMRKTHAKFTGTPGTFAHFGDSITVSMAFWSGLPYDHKNLGPEGEKAFALVKDYMKSDCWRNWKGPDFGSQGGMQVTWGEQNVDKWLKKLNPEVALIMFGTNDLREGRSVEDYANRTRAIARKCLDNGTVVILSTVPPRTKKLEESRAYAEAIRKLGRELNVPVEDFFQAVISRRPDDWDGSLDAFKGAKDSYDVPTLISRDGVHPSAPARYAGDYSEEALRNHGYNLRTYITLLEYADVIREVLKP